MLEGPILPSIIRYTIPVILTSVLQLLFTAADLVVVGNYCGSVSVAAVGSTNSITYLIINLFIGLSIGAGVCVAHAIGSKDEEEIHNTVHTAILTSIMGGMILTVVGLFLSEPLLRMMGTPNRVLPLAAVYMEVYFGGMTFTMVYNFCASILRAAGDTQSPLIYLLFSGGINVVLNLVFVIAFNMNVAGVALATIIAQAISAALCVRKLMLRQDACKLNLGKMKIYWPQFAKIVRIGLPAGIQSSLFSISNVTIQSAVNSFGDIFVAGNSAATNIEGFMYATLNSFQQAAVNFVGQNYGAKQYDRMKRITWLCFASVSVAGILVSWSVLFAGKTLLALYIGDSQQAISYGMIRFLICCPIYFLFGLQDVFTGVLRGYGKSLAPMIISVLGICGIRVGWVNTIFQIARFHTPECLYLSYPISWIVTFTIQMIFYIALLKQIKKQTSMQ